MRRHRFACICEDPDMHCHSNLSSWNCGYHIHYRISNSNAVYRYTYFRSVR
jgi:hypothetical protein